jgi:hypothetical protein
MEFLLNANGVGQYGNRHWGRPREYFVEGASPGLGDNIGLIITGVGGAILGTLNTQVAKSIVTSFKFVIRRGNCADFRLVLSELPSFPLVSRNYIRLKLQGQTRGVYYGQIKEEPDQGDGNQTEYVYSGIGMFNDCDDISESGKTFLQGSDIGENVLRLALENVDLETNIGINLEKIKTDTGIPLATDYVLDNSSIKVVLERFATMTNYDVGVDGDNELFFLPKNETPTKTFTAGYNLHELETVTNNGTVKNRIVATRTKLPNTNNNGYEIGAISIDEASQRKYGTAEESIQLPGNMSNSDMQVVADAVKEDLKEPKIAATATTYYLRNFSDIVERGSSRLILPYRSYKVEYDRLDDPTNTFTKFGAGDLVIQNDDINFIDGGRSMRLSFTSADGDYVETENRIIGKIEKIWFWYRSDVAGEVLRVGVGLGTWNQHFKDIQIPQVALNQFIPVPWDVTEYNLKEIDKLGFQIIEDTPGEISIDRILVEYKAFKHLTLENIEQDYIIEPNGSRIEMQLGVIPDRLEGYMKELYTISKQNRSAGEIR